MTMLEQVPDLPIEVPASPDLPFRLRCDGAPAGKLRLLRRQALPDLSDGAEDRLVQFSQDVHRPNAIGTLRTTIVIPFRSSTRRFIPHLTNRTWPDAQ